MFYSYLGLSLVIQKIRNENILSQEIKIGQTARTSKQITQTDLTLYAAVTGDFNPVHFDPVYAEQTSFKKPIAHSMIAAGLVSGLIGMKLPRPGTVYLKQTLDFLIPVKINDVITACVEVIALLDKNRVRLKTTCINQENVMVLEGDALVIAPNRALSINYFNRMMKTLMLIIRYELSNQAA